MDTRAKTWTRDDVLELARSYQEACVLAAAADLELFSALRAEPQTAQQLADRLGLDSRGTRIALDALGALGMVEKDDGGRYSAPPSLVPLLGRHGAGSVLAMAQHQANCLRRWSQLARVVQTGRPADRVPSVRGKEADDAAFIEAMDNISGPKADVVVGELGAIEFGRLLDIGGASGTWTIAFLRARPQARATIFDLPHVIPMARRRLSEAGLLDRVDLVSGDFQRDPLPSGADLAWVSAIVHQNSREENRALFQSVFRALGPGGTIAIRDIVMERSRTAPVAGALFAVNMLVGTEGGGTFTLDELEADLEQAGFRGVSLIRRDPAMDSVVMARKPPMT